MYRTGRQDEKTGSIKSASQEKENGCRCSFTIVMRQLILFYLSSSHVQHSIPRRKRMKIIDVANVISGPNPHHVDARKIYDSPHAVVVVITLKPGESLKKHITPVDVFFYVLEGSGVIEIGSERQTVGKDMLVESPARIPHRWMNESPSLFRVLVVKVPRPVEETKVL
jgi:quercetin dioxygenase-like cupin family protein